MIRRSITAKMSALVVIPLVALIGLWLFATALTIGPARDLRSAETLSAGVGDPARSVVARLQAERRWSVVRQGYRTAKAPSAEIETALIKQRTITDDAIAAFLDKAGSREVADAANPVVASRLQEFRAVLADLPNGRQSIDGPTASRAAIMHLYTGVIDAAYHLFSPLAEVNDPELGRISRTLLGLSRAREFVAQEDALISGVAAAGTMTPSDITEISGAIGAQRRLFADAAAELPAAEGTAYAAMRKQDAFVQLAYMEDQVIRDGRADKALPINPQVWRAAIDTVLTDLNEFEVKVAIPRRERALDVSRAAYLRLSLAGVAGLGAVLLALWIGLRVARSVTSRLRRLRDVASNLADVELPDVVSRLRHGAKVEGAEGDKTLEFGLDEIGEVGYAFSAVRRTAVHAAIDESSLRHGLNEVFLNVARRSQTLLHRQLTLLDRMERRSSDPQELEDLFRLDHLATRMRRHAEDLVILAGGAPGRGWRHPVPAVDVVRGAVSEIEEYIRVTVERIPPVAISGRAVGDIIHLLAELVENGTSFSPPHTRVEVSGELIPTEDQEGFDLTISVEDRGLGMSAEALAEANERLAAPPDFDPANSARLGLLVVGRLAARHGISVRLRRSAHGGVSAVVVVPEELVAEIVQRPTTTVPAQRSAQAPAIAATATGRVAIGATAATPESTAKAAFAAHAATEVLPRVTDEPEPSVEPSRAAAPDVSVPPADVVVEVGSDLGGLPQRRRNRAEAAAPEPESPAEGSAEVSRTPQRVRATMAAFQSGSASGRTAARQSAAEQDHTDELGEAQ
ncbi:signal transduction histidine kinase [Allocatelliglobosispora scoriae]|uniref:histidine kinase n=1 Tax=Allocatelliglobosispora scoriae TaxID=643052 RepID=A0A841BXU5_9ACTN|nr:nitrate- and nitrite sensing domain-containing protein [Allocatelliglobosispora scoriae]MBB5872984.1 signal transduction histidine kinase [Allocatelliglobosispora scoriae]